MPPLERQRGQLAVSAIQLDQALAGVQNGEHWTGYLQLPAAVFAPISTGPTDQLAAELGDVLARYDTVRQTRAYRRIADMSAFQTTYQHLVAYLGMLEQGPASEELPPPPADTGLPLLTPPSDA